ATNDRRDLGGANRTEGGCLPIGHLVDALAHGLVMSAAHGSSPPEHPRSSTLPSRKCWSAKLHPCTLNGSAASLRGTDVPRYAALNEVPIPKYGVVEDVLLSVC